MPSDILAHGLGAGHKARTQPARSQPVEDAAQAASPVSRRHPFAGIVQVRDVHNGSSRHCQCGYQVRQPEMAVHQHRIDVPQVCAQSACGREDVGAETERIGQIHVVNPAGW